MNKLLMVTCLLYCVIALPTGVTPSSKYVVEVRAVVDLAGIETWTERTGKTVEDLRLEMNKTFREISEFYYKSLSKYRLDIDVLLRDVVLLDSNIIKPQLEDKIRCINILSAFRDWVIANNTQQVNNRYDLSLLFTGYNMFLYDYGDCDVTTGIAYGGRVCSTYGLGIVELSGTSKDAFIASHEIGHILGVKHDGWNWTSACRASDGYVMSSVPNITSPNHPNFSPCSAKLIKIQMKLLNILNKNCLVRSLH